jgi:hypothetical protein
MMLVIVAKAKKEPISIEDVPNQKLVGRIAGMLSHLHGVGCERDRAGNRELHFNDYVLLVLLYLFNPLIDSMRTLQQASALPQLQKRLGIKRFSLGSFSESCRVFLPKMLRGVIDQLAGELRTVDRPELLNTLTGRKPNKRMVTLMAFYLQGLASDEDVQAELSRPDNTGIKLRKRAEELKKFGIEIKG